MSKSKRTIANEETQEAETVLATSSIGTYHNLKFSNPNTARDTARDTKRQGKRNSSIFDQVSTNECNSARNLIDFYDKNEKANIDLK